MRIKRGVSCTKCSDTALDKWRAAGHFGPTDGDGSELTYHYHVRLTPPYTLGCFGPSWQRCVASPRSRSSACA